MPSSQISHTSGATTQLFSGGFGSPWSGLPNQTRSLALYLPPTQSGSVWITFSGTALNVSSGGVLGANGLQDAFPMYAGDRMTVQLPAGGVEALRVGTVAGCSGIRLFWEDGNNVGF